MSFPKSVYNLYLDQLLLAQHASLTIEENPSAFKEFKTYVHKILGTADLFGDNDLSQICRQIEDSPDLTPKNAPQLFLTQFQKHLEASIKKSKQTLQALD